MQGLQSLSSDTVLYRVKPGDSLNKIINHYFGTVTLQTRNELIDDIVRKNSALKNPNVIYPNQLLQIDIPPQYCASPLANKITPFINMDKGHLKSLQNQYRAANPKERSLLSALTPVMLGAGAASVTMVDKTFKTNTPLVANIAEIYNDFKSGKITKGQYDGQRKKILSKLKAKLGPTNLLLNGNKPLNEVIRISRKKGKKPTKNIAQQVKRMGKLSKLASRGGGVLLSATALGVSCYEIANTEDITKKNEILVENLGALGGGLIYGTIVTVLLIGTPIGWIAALAIGVGAALTGYGAGQGVKYLYTKSGTKVDITKAMGVNHLCY